MGFIEHLHRDRVVVGLEVKDKSDLFGKLADIAAGFGIGPPRDEIERKLWEREETMSTGIGNGVGIPHTLLEAVDELKAFLVTLGRSIPYDAIDGAPVQLIVLIFGNPRDPGTSLKALAVLGRIMRDRKFIQEICRTEDPDAILELIREKEQKRRR